MSRNRLREGPSGPLFPLGPYAIREEFIGGTAAVNTSSSSNANIGENNWNVSDLGGGGDIRKQPSTEGMRGWYRLEANPGTIFGLYLGSNPASSGGAVLLEQVDYFLWRGVLNGPIFTFNNGSTRMGIGSVSSQPGFGDESLFIEASPNDSDYFRFVTKNLLGTKTSETNLLLDAEVHDFVFQRTAPGKWKFLIDGVQRATRNTAVEDDFTPADSTFLGFMAQSEAASDPAQLGLDRFWFEPTGP